MKINVIRVLCIFYSVLILTACTEESEISRVDSSESSGMRTEGTVSSDGNYDDPGAFSENSEGMETESPIDRLGSAMCHGSGPVMFSHSPMRIEDIKFILPYGDVVGGHVTPIDHMYFEPKDRSLGRDIYEVRAIHDAVLFGISPRDVTPETSEIRAREWRVDMAHTCTFTSYLDLLTSLDPAIEEEWAKTEGGMTGYWEGIPVKAGQLIGYIGGQTLDFGVYDYEVTLTGFINPAAYASLEPWKIHTVDPFQYFPDDTKDALLEKMIRRVEPRSGKIDYDVQGTLSGNWFERGTNWYDGINPMKYWEGHLSIAPHQIDPSLWRIAIGSLDTFNNNFMMLGEPDPLQVTTDTGLVIYELKRQTLYIPASPDKKWWEAPFDENDIYGAKISPESEGVVLVQLEQGGVLTVEVKLGVTKENTGGFTDSARYYER